MLQIPVKYVGLKARKADNVAGTGLVWMRGETLPVPADLVPQLLRHTDVWAVNGDTVETGEPPAPPAKKVEDELEEPLKVALPNIATMNKAALAQLAMTRFGEQLDAKLPAAAMRDRIVALENGGRQRSE